MIDFQKLPSPCFVLDEQLLDRNLAVIDRVRRESGAEVIVALKACAMWSIFPELAQHSDGATASSLAEARLVFEEFGRPAHTYAPVYTDRNIEEILDCSDHITFNSVAQFERFGQMALLRGISCGLRINPGYSPVETDLYNPCVPGSRLGIPAGELKELPAGVEGLHFHVLCESRPEHLRLALDAVEKRFGRFLDRIKWLNMGGGHLMTHKDYDCDELIRILQEFKAKYPNLRLILEPGSAFTWRTGYLVSTVEDIVENGGVLTGLTAPKGELLSYGGTRSAVIPANTDWAVPRYEVGSKKLDVYLAGEQCSAGEDPAHAQYKEVGNKGSMSTVVQWHDDIPVEYDIAVRVR